MEDERITPVVLCGGSGTRLWPRSRGQATKPFLRLVGKTTLFEEALARCADPAEFAPPIVVTGQSHLAMVESQLPAELGGSIVVEPAAKNTAAAIALAACRLPEDAIMLVCPSDHHIADNAAFRAAAGQAAALARQGWLVAFGIEPSRPETGYGYIKRGVALGPDAGGGYRIERFVEKPDLIRAEAFLAEGGYSWNGGLFAFRAGTFLEELERYRPHLAAAARDAVAQGHAEGRLFHPAAAPFATIVGESVDYAVMEQTGRAAMVPVAMGWSDIGTWFALREARLGEADGHGNLARGHADFLDCSNVMVDTDGPRVSVVGLSDVIVVVDGGEVLVTSASGAALVGKLKGPTGG